MKYDMRSNRGPLILLALLALAACGDSGSGPDGGGVIISEGGQQLFPCSQPGQSCNPHDSCAINPICSPQGLCIPTNYQDCDDGLDCTEDTCTGGGGCSVSVKSGFCAITIQDGTGTNKQCIPVGTVNPQNPCQVCNPTVDAERWTGWSSGTCDDGDPCTINDLCMAGQCVGQFISCGDGLSCTDDVCDGQGGCSNPLSPGRCLIAGTCYNEGEASADGCSTCDTASNPLTWTPRASFCQIGPFCVAPNALDTTGCGICDPAISTTSYSPTPNTCLIDQTCFQGGAPDATGCAQCNPGVSTTSFTVNSGKCVIDGTCYDDILSDPGAVSATGCGVCDAASNSGWWTPVSGSTASDSDFESGLGAFTASPLTAGVGWQISTARALSGTSSLYYGHLTNKNYDSGAANSGTATRAALTLTGGQKSALFFWLFIDTESSAEFDVLTVKVNGDTVWQKAPATVPSGHYKRWFPVEIDLSSYAGQSVTITFDFATNDDWSNTGEGVYLDDIAVISGCGALP